MLLSDLTPNIKNPRKITDEKLQMLEASLKEFGDLSGFIFNRKLGRLEGGHQRQKVMPPDAEVIIEQKFDEPTTTGTVALGKVLWNGEKYAYREVEWNEPKSLAANVAANKHGGEWDLPALEQIMLTLDENNVDLSLTGFGEEEIADLFDWKTPVELENKSGELDLNEFSNFEHQCPKCGFEWNDTAKDQATNGSLEPDGP